MSENENSLIQDNDEPVNGKNIYLKGSCGESDERVSQTSAMVR